MKLLVVISSLHLGGAERVVSLLTQEWTKKHEVKIVLYDISHPAYSYGGELIDLNLPAKTGWLDKSVQAIRRVMQLARLFIDNKPDKIISFMESANFPCILAAVLTKKRSRLVVSVHNDPAHFPVFYRKLLPLLYRLPSKVVAVSSGVANALLAMGVPQKKLGIIPNPTSSHAPTITTPLAQPNEMPHRYILGVGRLHQQKGFDRLIDAFSRIKDRSFHLVLLGEGEERNRLTDQAERLGVSDRVYMPGAVKDVWPWYRHALCFVLSSRHEGWGNVLMEAMSQGCPVIAFDCKYGPSEIIEDGVSGRLVNDGNVEALRESLVLLITDSLQRKGFAVQGIKRAAEFNVSKLAEKWLC